MKNNLIAKTITSNGQRTVIQFKPSFSISKIGKTLSQIPLFSLCLVAYDVTTFGKQTEQAENPKKSRQFQKIMKTKTKALLVGINDYAPSGPGGPDLNGCVNDVRDMANTLVICGFKAEYIRILTDSRATRNEILQNLDWLIGGAKSGDSIVFYYSGHGSYKVDLSGDEPDGRDEVICPHDWPQYILDDELSQIFLRIPDGVNLEVFTDCCFSGTITRNLPFSKNDQPLFAPRFIPPPFDYSFYEEFKVKYAKKKKAKVIAPNNSLNHTLWAASNDGQLSNETDIEGLVRGIFTYHLCSVLRASSGLITRDKLDSLVSSSVARHGFDQTPQLETSAAKISQPIFD